jgi:hypothetical protein
VKDLPRKNTWPDTVARKTRATLWLTLDNHAGDGDRSSAHGMYGMQSPPCRWHLQVGQVVLSSDQDRSTFYLNTQRATEADPREGYSFQAGYFDTLPTLPTLRSLLVTWSLKKNGRGLLPTDALPMRGFPLSTYDSLQSFTIHAKSARNGTRQDLELSVDSLKVFQAPQESL